MDAIFYKEGRIRPVVAAVKSLASALSIGSGAAVGREGRSSRSVHRSARPLASSSGWRPGNGSRSWRPARRRHCGDIQHADRRCHVRNRADAAGGQCAHLLAGCIGDGHRNFHRSIVHWSQACVRYAAHIGGGGPSRTPLCTLAVCGARAAIGLAATGFIRGLHSMEAYSTESVIPICAMRWAWSCRNSNLCALSLRGQYYVDVWVMQRFKTFCWVDSVRRPACDTFLLQTARDDREPRVGLLGGIFSPSLSWAPRWVVRSGLRSIDLSVPRHQCRRFCDRGHGRMVGEAPARR